MRAAQLLAPIELRFCYFGICKHEDMSKFVWELEKDFPSSGVSRHIGRNSTF